MYKLKRFTILLFVLLVITSCGQAPKTEIENTEVDTNITTETESEVIDLHPYDFTLCFAGDISLDENAVTTAQLDGSENGIYDCISPELIDIMKDADEAIAEIYADLNRKLKEEEQLMKRNQLELKSTLQDLLDTEKYLKLIEDRNKVSEE